MHVEPVPISAWPTRHLPHVEVSVTAAASAHSAVQSVAQGDDAAQPQVLSS